AGAAAPATPRPASRSCRDRRLLRGRARLLRRRLLAQFGEAVLRRDRDRLEQRPDRRGVDVLHPREVLERGAALGREGEEVTALLDPLAAGDLPAAEPPRPR